MVQRAAAPREPADGHEVGREHPAEGRAHADQVGEEAVRQLAHRAPGAVATVAGVAAQ